MILHFSPPSAASGHVELPLNPPPHNLPPSFPTVALLRDCNWLCQLRNKVSLQIRRVYLALEVFALYTLFNRAFRKIHRENKLFVILIYIIIMLNVNNVCKSKFNLLWSTCVLFIVCLYICVCECLLKTTIIKQNTKMILIVGVPSRQALPGFLFTAPPSVCVPEVIGVLAVWISNQKTKKWCQNQTLHLFKINLFLFMCVLFLFIVCLYNFVCECLLQNNNHQKNIKIILIAGVPSSQELLGFLITAPPSVCVPDVIGALAMWIQNQKKKKRVWKGGFPHLVLKAGIMRGVVKFKWGISDLFPQQLGGLFCSLWAN